jgi:Leucine-rich repeat (LRR) protein
MSPKLFFAFVLLCQTVNINFACKNGLLSTINYTVMDSNKNSQNIYNSTVISSRHNGGFIVAGNQNLTKLCCEHLHITHKVNLVQFGNFQIEEIEPECFSEQIYKVFNKLVFVANKFPIVRKGMFKNLQCRLINLSVNNIKSIENEAFEYLPNVEKIELSSNHLIQLNPKSFLQTPQLKTLDLSSNRIKFIEKESFAFFERNCPSIVLEFNEISKVDKGVFNGMTAENAILRWKNNFVEWLPEEIFDGHTFIDIDLTKNPLKKFSNRFCEKNCRMVMFRIESEHLDEETTENVTIWAENKNIETFQTQLNYLIRDKIIEELCSGSENNSYNSDILVLAMWSTWLMMK